MNPQPKPEPEKKKTCKVVGCDIKVKPSFKYCKMHTKSILNIKSKSRPDKVSKKKSGLTKARSDAKASIQLYARLSNSINGMCTCVTCGVTRRYNDKMHGGHFISAFFSGTCFDLKNIHPQCERCNLFKMGDGITISNFENHIELTYGEDAVQNLRIQSKQTIKRTVFEYIGIKKYYDELNKKLLEEINGN